MMRFEAGFFHLVFFWYLLCVVIMGGCRGDSKNVLFAVIFNPSFAFEGGVIFISHKRKTVAFSGVFVLDQNL